MTISMSINPESVSHQLISDMRKINEDQKTRGIVIGVSGGLDSAVVAFLAARAFSASQIRLLFLPERDSQLQSERDAFLVAGHLELPLTVISIEPLMKSMGAYEGAVPFWTKSGYSNRLIYEMYRKVKGDSLYLKGLTPYDNKWFSEARSFYRLKHRLRMVILYQQAEKREFLVAGCINKTEYLTGFYVPHGDAAADIFPLLPYYKSQVRQLAAWLNVPKAIIAKPPSPDLLPGLDDEQVLGMDYTRLDRVLLCLEKGFTLQAAAEQSGASPEAVRMCREMLTLAQRRQQTEPTIK